MDIKVEMIFENGILKGKEFQDILTQKQYVTIPFIINGNKEGLLECLMQMAEHATWRVISKVKNYLASKNPELLKDFPDYQLKIDIGENVFDIITSDHAYHTGCYNTILDSLVELPKLARNSIKMMFKVLSLGKVISYDIKHWNGLYSRKFWVVEDIREMPIEIYKMIQEKEKEVI